jgi:GAF domain-containing protein/anti-sigma regulatory factor (Ser/Thr protein kinase)
MSASARTASAGSDTEPVHAFFPPDSSAVSRARSFVRGTLVRWGADAVVDDAVLLVSELVTNAIVHAGTDAEVTCLVVDGSVRVEVADRHPARSLPAPALDGDMDSESGRGLYLSAALASSWGVSYDHARKRVWFSLDLPGTDVDAGEGDGSGATRSAQAGEADGTSATPRGVAAMEVSGTPASDSASRAGSDAAGEPEVPVGPSSWDLSALGESPDLRANVDDLLGRVADRIRDLFGADAALALLASDDGDDLELRAATGLDAATLGAASAGIKPAVAASRIDLSLLPSVHADVTGDPSAGAALPFLDGSGLRAVLTAPLLAHGRLAGMVAVAARDAGRFDLDDAGRLQQAADSVAPAVESARLGELERRRRGVLSFIAEASELLAGTLDADRTLALAAQLVVPRLARWCVVHLTDDTGRARPRHVWHENESRNDDLLTLVGCAGPPAASDRQGRSWPGLVEAAAKLAVDEVAADTTAGYRELAAAELLVLPLTARGRRLGTLCLGNASGERFRRELVELAVDLSRRVALALDNALLYAERQRASMLLQRSLLPAGIPDVPGVDVHVVYEAAGERDEAGGDFYDLFPIRDGAWGFAIGDVCGTGPEAAAVTGLARHALRLLAKEGHSGPAVLDRLNRAILDEGERARFLTLVYGELEPRPDGSVNLALVCAGHGATAGRHGTRRGQPAAAARRAARARPVRRGGRARARRAAARLHRRRHRTPRGHPHARRGRPGRAADQLHGPERGRRRQTRPPGGRDLHQHATPGRHGHPRAARRLTVRRFRCRRWSRARPRRNDHAMTFG